MLNCKVLKGFFLIGIFCLFQVLGFGSTGSPVFLVFGAKTGWIGQKLVHCIQEKGYLAVAAEARLEDRFSVESEIKNIQPDYIINAAGLTGRPNIDWCEVHQVETIRANLIGALNLMDIANVYGIHVTNFGTGCIYQYDEMHPMYSGKGFTEEDIPNFSGSFYSRTKGMLNTLIQSYPNVLNLRVRMPISSDLHPRSFITKIVHYEKVINIPNSVTILDDLLPVAIDMTVKNCRGNYNFTNPGTISHNELLALYREYIDPNFSWKNFTIEEQDCILKAPRSNNELDVSKLMREFPNIPHVSESIRNVFIKIKNSLKG